MLLLSFGVAYKYHDQPISISLRNEAKLWSLIRYVLLAEVRPRDPTQDPGAPEQREPCQERDHLYRGRHGSVHHHVWSNLRRSAQWSNRWGISTRVREVPQHRFRQGRYLNRIDRAFNLDGGLARREDIWKSCHVKPFNSVAAFDKDTPRLSMSRKYEKCGARITINSHQSSNYLLTINVKVLYQFISRININDVINTFYLTGKDNVMLILIYR